jgi:hypothetical protein
VRSPVIPDGRKSTDRESRPTPVSDRYRWISSFAVALMGASSPRTALDAAIIWSVLDWSVVKNAFGVTGRFDGRR